VLPFVFIIAIFYVTVNIIAAFAGFNSKSHRGFPHEGNQEITSLLF
jgi:hypothetical protein